MATKWIELDVVTSQRQLCNPTWIDYLRLSNDFSGFYKRSINAGTWKSTITSHIQDVAFDVTAWTGAHVTLYPIPHCTASVPETKNLNACIQLNDITSTSFSNRCPRTSFLQASSKSEDISTPRIFHFPGDFSTSHIEVALQDKRNTTSFDACRLHIFCNWS